MSNMAVSSAALASSMYSHASQLGRGEAVAVVTIYEGIRPRNLIDLMYAASFGRCNRVARSQRTRISQLTKKTGSRYRCGSAAARQVLLTLETVVQSVEGKNPATS